MTLRRAGCAFLVRTGSEGKRGWCAPVCACIVLEIEIVLSARVGQRMRGENEDAETDLMKCRKHFLGSVPRASCLTKSCST